MTEKLVSFLFFAILLALGYHFGFNLIYRHFSTSADAVQSHWMVVFAGLPALLLLGLGWMMGFFRKLGWADLCALGIVIGLTYLTVPASYSCGTGCF